MSRADAMAAVPVKSSLSDLWWTARNPPLDPTNSFSGKSILITGSNTGLGFEAAKKFAALGASKLILGVRSIERGQAAKDRIEQSLDGRSSSPLIEVIQLDMLKLSSVEEFAREVSERFTEVHIVVLNAGIAAVDYFTSPEGWESSLQVNVISTAYLALLLLPKLRQTTLSTGSLSILEIVTSSGHGDVKAPSLESNGRIIDKVNDRSNFNFLTQYQITKLLAMYVMKQISATTLADEVVVFAVCPGLCKSDIARDGSFVLRKIDGIWKSLFARTAEQGSRTLVSGATLGADARGGFWTHDRLAT
ncbi:Fc.00g057050.m01.CDS01 [Cosmosporella sp. VM-42]